MTDILEKVKRKIEQLNQRIELRSGENYHDESKKVLIFEERLGVYEELLPEIASLITTIESLQREIQTKDSQIKHLSEGLEWVKELGQRRKHAAYVNIAEDAFIKSNACIQEGEKP